MIKFLKKAVSAFLASIMCLPAGLVNIASAEENDMNTVTTVTLSDTDNGIMQFSQECMDASTADQDGYHMVQVSEDGELNQIENDGSIWAFNAGDKVEVELIPDEEYNVKSFTIKDSNSGDVMAHKETMDNVFSFTMPSQSLTVEAQFSNSSTVEIVPGDELANGGELDVESKYHDLTETAEVSQEEVEEVIFDLATESYIKANLNPEYITLGNKFSPVDILGVKQGLFDGRHVEEGDTIDSILYTLENGVDGEEEYEKSELKAISQINSMAYIYDFNEESDYYVAYANTMVKDGDYSVKDWAFAFNDFSGDGYEGCVYDENTGLFYIPKQLYKDVTEKEGHKPYVMSFQVQFMQVFYNKEAVNGISDTAVPAMQSDICTVDVNEEESTIDVGMDTQDIFDLETVTSVSAGLDPDNMNVAVNGVIIPSNTYEYNAETGELVIAMSSASIISVEAWEGEKTLQDEIKKLTAEEAEALSFDEMKAFNSHVIKLNEKEIPDKDGKYMDNVIKVYGKIQYTGRKSQASDPWYVLSGYEEGAKPLRDWLNNSGSKPAIETNMVHVNNAAGSTYAPMKIDLSHYKLRTSSHTWANALKKFIKAIDNCWGSCYHITSPLKLQSGKAEVNLRVVKYKLGKKNTKKDGSWTRDGYIVFGLLTPQLCTQTTTTLLKVKFQAEGKPEDGKDPLGLYLYKIENNGGDGEDATMSLMSDATLKGAVYTVKFFKDADFGSVKELKKQIKNNGLKASATWQFKTKSASSLGSDDYRRHGEKVEEDYNNSYLEIAGIDFSPKNFDKDRSKWNNDFLINKEEKLESYRNKWGQKGTYWVYEEKDKAPRGFLAGGQITAVDNWMNEVANDACQGFVVTMKLSSDSDKSVLKVNGSKSDSSVSVVAGKQPSASVLAEENADIVDVTSTSENVDTGDQYAKPGIIHIKDDIIVTSLVGIPNAEYYITTQVLDKDTGEFLDVSWDESAVTVTDNEDTPIPFSTNVTPCDPDERYKIFGSSITTKTDAPKMLEEEFNNIFLTVQGTVDASGLSGHTLVFINMVHVVDPDAHEEPDEPSDDGGDTVVDTSGDGDEWTEPAFDPAHDLTVVTEDEDMSEYIYIEPDTPEAATDIMSNQNQRKIGTGESIAFSGKYKDESCTEGGGNILQSMTDTIKYTGLESGKNYTIKGWLADAETGEAVKDASGNGITIKPDTSSQAAASGGSGTWDVVYEFDGTGLEGRKLVSFIEIYDGDTKKFEFKDKNDKKETFFIPEVKTKLIDLDTNTNITAEGESSLVDVISYKSLLPNTEYKVVSKLIDIETGEVGIDSNKKKMESESKQRTGNEDSGEWEIELNFDIDKGGAGKTYVAYEEIYIEREKPGSGEWILIAEHKDITDQNQMTTVPLLTTIALDQKTDTHLSYAENYVNVYDTIHYENLIPNTKYIVVSQLIDAETQAIITDDNNVEQTLETELFTDVDHDAGRYGSYGDIVPENHDGNGVTFSLNAESFKGRTVVVYEALYLEDENGGRKLVADHKDPLDEKQTIHFPKIWTNAIDIETQTNISYADETAIIKDTVSYENLIPGLTYELHGRVIDRKKTLESGGKEVVAVGSDGKNAENKVIFTPDTANGEQELTFDIDLKKYVDDLNKSYAGAVFVVYEDLYVIQRYDGADDRSIVASHTDINDENQTIYLPKITTSLDDAKTGTKLSYAEKDAHLIDTINYYNLKPSTQYTVKGRLYNMEDGKVLEGSEKVQQFTSNAEGTGSWKLDYTFDASKMKGTILVAYAEVYIGDKVVATHDEFWDVEERVYFPKITTDATDLKTGDNISLAEKTMKIIDTVHYKSLSPGYTYKLVSELRDQATNEIVTDDAGNKQVLTTHFKTDFELLDKQYLTFGDIVPKAADSDEATFTLDAEYFAGRTLVIFERLYIENESGEHLIADHQDLLDERQTISVGGIWSDAIDMDTFTKTLHSGTGRATVIDTVGYTNLLPGHTYELRGYVVEKDRTIHAGTNVLATAPGGGEARNSTQFVPSSSKGSVRLSFDIDVSKYATDEYKGAVLVVYQELYHIKDDKGNADMRLVASHTDIGNLRQTVYIPYIWTDLNDYKTGTKVLLAEEDAHIVDTISYTRFQPNSTYTVKGKIIDMEKGTTLTDSAGKKVEKEMEVTASDTGAGEWKLDYEFDASKLQGKILVAYADVYVKNGERPDILSRVATHSNFWNTKQRVYIPKISTVATDQKTNSHVTFAEDNAWVTDRIYYSHLQPDTEYRLISKLVDKDTGEVVVDDKKVKQEIESTFITTPNESQEKYIQTIKNPFAGSDDTGIGYSYGYIIPADGTILPDGSKYKGVVFNFDAHTFEGRTLVIFEELQMRTKDGYQTIATHMDINDENQTVHIPKIRTNAVDSETLTHSSKMDGAMTVIDTITYENLIPGFTYEVEGFLMDKPRDDSKGYSVIKDAKGNPITNKKEFVADKPNGTVKLSLSGDARSFQTDEGEFSSETLVVFERLYLKNNKDASDDRLVVAVHEDINDENQTIYCPRISTKVVSYDFGEESKDGDADHVIGFAAYECDYCKTRFVSEHDVQSHIKKTPACLNFKNSYSTVTEATIYDRVYYENLVPNRTYEIVGHIIDTKTGKAVTINNRMVQSEKKYFTPGTSNGEVDVVFHVTGLDLAGGRYVCYEELFYNGTSIAEHKDKFDDNQTFYVPGMVTSAMDYDTKSNISKADTISTIIDTVEMTGLKENEKYRLSSVLMDATTDAKSGAKSSNYGSYFIDGTGNAVHAKEWRKKGSTVWHGMDEYFTIDSALSPEDYRGTAAIEVKFEVDTITEHGGKDYQGMTYVVFQELYTENGTLVAQHKDITDKQQTIYVGGMYTVALDGSPVNGTMTNLMDGTSGDRTLVDYIYYSNLLPNKSYYVTTNVYIKEMSRGGDPDKDVMQPFEAENAVGLMAHQYTTKSTGSGYWAVNISLSGEKLKDYLDKSENGITLVVYEEIHEGTMDGKRVALENNLYNESQSVHIPKIKSTVEEDKVSGLHYTLSEGKWICDNDECVVYACDGCGKEFHSEEEAADHLYDCREGDSYTCTSGVFSSKAEAEAHVAPVYECNNCKLHFTDEADAEAHVNGRCKDAAVVRATQLVRDEDNNVVNELWYACSSCGSQFKTNKECLDHIGGSDTCYNYTNINAAHHSYTNINAGITDTVSYSNLIPGKKYRIQGKIYNTETKEPALTEKEEEITSSRTFIPMASQGSVKLDFEFDGTYLAGHKYAVYTEILLVDARYDTTTASTINNPVVISKHNENLDDKEEAFYIPKVSTSAKDYYTQTNVTKADSTTTIVDDVTFEGLNTTDKYCIKGIIMDKETMKPLVLADGSSAEASTGTFQVDSSTDGGRGYGTKQLRFTFSTSDLEGKTLVVFEKLYLVRGNKETLIGQHTEIMDEKQTTHIPKMRTYAYDAETGEQTAGADESVTLVDRVVMENLVKGKRYKLEAKLVDPATGKVLQDVNGHDITGTLDMYENRYNEFTASTSGRTERTVKFVFDGSDMAGKSVVVHETLYMEDTTGSFSVIANHCPLPDVNNMEGEDLDYRNQRIDFPGISTSAKDALTGTEFTKDSETATIIDTVTYNNLTAGLEYKLVGSIYDLKHKTLLTDTFNDTFTSTKYFTPDATGNGTVDLSFTFNTKDMAGNTFVVYEELYLNGEKIAEHKDPSDLKQTFKIPTIKTSAVSEDIGLKMTMADKDAVIIDTVTYKNLIEDREYRVTGKLMDKNTGKPLLDAQEEEITGETVFRPETADGTVEVEFRFDASKMEGMAAVVYEELFYMDKLIADHKEIKDEGQTVYFPKVRSLAKGNETDGTHIGPADSIMTITDTVFYENLIGDREYHIAGVVMDAETGKPAIDANGDEVREEKTFTTAHPDADAISKAVSGSEDMVFTFDATGMRGKTLVIYEHIYYHKTTTSYLDYEVGKHAELEDEAQMIHIPEIGTTAWDSETRQHITKADDDATIIDTVAYKNLVPDKEYTLDAYLIDLDTGGEVAVDDYGVEIKGTTTFVPKDWEGTVDVRFDNYEITSLAGHTLVAFEYLYYKGILIEHHDNPEDGAQTINIPKIATHASNFESDSGNANAEAYVNVVDEIEYWNLVPGLEYIAVGIIINKETGQPARDAEGKYIKGTTTFTPDNADGTTEVVFTFNAEGMEETDLVVFEEIFYQGDLYERKSVAEHSDLMDEEQSVSIPKIKTDMLDSKTGLKLANAEEDMVLHDTVRYSGLVSGTEYELVGTLYDTEIGKAAVDDNGTEITASRNFTAEEKKGHETIVFEFSGKNLEGHTLAAKTELFVVNDGDNLSAVTKVHNNDLSDINEMIYIPKARTTVVDNETAINYSKVTGEVSITDTIKYENLVPGYSYTATGVLVDRETQEPVKDADGNGITSETAFTVTKPDGTVDVVFTFNASGFDGMTYNVFETITCNGEVVAEHKDTEDEEQNIHFTKLSTEAVDANSELQLTLADKNAVITDIIYYENLKPGEEYTITGRLFDKTTGLPILDPAVNVNPYEMLDNILEHWVCDQCAERFDSKEDALAHVNASATDEHKNTTLVLSFDSDEYNALIESATMKVTENFIPEETTGHIPVNYEIDATSLAGHTIVAFATITYKGIDMAVHHDLGDEAETIYVPEIGTTAMDAESVMHVSKADGSVTITDRVEYKNLVTGMNYIMTGHLVDKATGEPVVDANGSQVTGETKFQPVDADGYVDVTFTFDGSHLAGHTLVAYEYLAAEYKDNPVIAKHEDIEDEDQTIELPKIETKAFDSVTKENVVKAGEKTTITDRVYYHNLQINETYTLKGILIDKATGKAILDAEGKEISAEKVFTAKDHDGYVDVEFVFDASAHTGKTLVAFEELFLKGYSIASHENPDDEEQTVYIPKVSTTAKDKKTGTHMAYADDMVTIIDTVSYSNVAPGTEYTIVGTIVDGETGETLAGPETETFTADASNGTKEVEFTVKADKLKGRKVVVFEELQTKFVTSRKDVETYVCNQCGRVYADKQHAVWHFEDSEECYDYTATFETIKEYGENTTIAEHKDLDDVSQTVYIPEIHTTAKDKETNTKLSYGKDAVVVDTIHYKGLQAGVEYTVSGILMDKETGKPVTVDGKEVTADAKFTPDKTDGSVDVEFRFDATKYAGHALVAYEELYVEGKLVADHKNPDDEEQTVYVPEIGTTAVDSATKEHIGAVGESTIIDTVKYHNLVPGLEYTIKGVLMDKKTGEALTYDVSSADDSVVDAVVGAITGNNKKAYTAEAKFTPAGADGTVSLEFKFNAPEGTDIVVFEELYYKEKLIAGHKDIEDKSQTVQYPKVRTHATNKETGDKIIPATGKVTIVDKVTYSNLIVGKEYTINGKLMDKETGKETGYTASKTFIAEKADGEVNIEFEVDASALAGKSVVAFETLNYEGIELTSHADLTDEDQTVDIPEIATHAADKATQTHVVSYGDKVIVEDKVTYKNLTVGREYTMKGTLMLKTKDGVKDTGITAEKVFVPETRNGEVVLEFVVDSTKYAGEALVAYEKLFDKDTEIARHENPDDEDQTVFVPEIKTSASSNGSKGIVAAKDCVITDTVTYRNLVPGLSYKVAGKLMDKATGKPLSSNGQLITAETAFTPSSPDGTVDVTFKFDASACSSMAIVVFEELTLNGVTVAVHEDINDEEQTVRFPEIATHAADKATQTHVVSYGDNVIVEDKVTYKNLTAGREYTMKGTLMLKGENGVENTGITAEKTFKPEKPDGEVVLEFVVDSTKYAGKALVAYEKLFGKDVEIARHENPDDEDQTVYVPGIRTNASIGGEKTADVSKTTVIIDTVSYKNLVPGLEYTMHGKLINKANGNALSIGGKVITSEVKFTPVSADGTVEMKFAFDSSACKGMSVVVFEDLSLEGKLVATHADITDKDQTVTFNTPDNPDIPDNPDTPEEPDKPSIRTNASVGNMKQAAALESTTIVDTVTYKNLTAGTEYTLKGKLVNKANGKTLSINGKAVTAEMKFTPSEKNGSVDMKFIFNSSACAGMSVVVYEYLYIGSSIVVSHADVDDEAQTVTFRSPKQPEIRTKATINGKKSARAAKSVTVTDKVTYKNLVPGTKYTLKGKLVNKASGRTLSISGKALEAEKTFVPEKPDGSVKLEFKFDASACGGMSMVAFEYLYENGRIIATHADINDADQTVTVTDKDMPVVTPAPVPNRKPGKNPSVTPDEPNPPSKVKTGDEYGLIVALFITAIVVLGVAIAVVKKKENE